MADSYRVDIDEERCKGCCLCVESCPQGIISMAERTNKLGYHPAEVVYQGDCIGCAFCASICPDVVIKVFKSIQEV